MNRTKIAYRTAGALAVTAFVLLIAGVWIDDGRWVTTAAILAGAGLIALLTAAGFTARDDELAKANDPRLPIRATDQRPNK